MTYKEIYNGINGMRKQAFLNKVGMKKTALTSLNKLLGVASKVSGRVGGSPTIRNIRNNLKIATGLSEARRAVLADMRNGSRAIDIGDLHLLDKLKSDYLRDVRRKINLLDPTKFPPNNKLPMDYEKLLRDNQALVGRSHGRSYNGVYGDLSRDDYGSFLSLYNDLGGQSGPLNFGVLGGLGGYIDDMGKISAISTDINKVRRLKEFINTYGINDPVLTDLFKNKWLNN